MAIHEADWSGERGVAVDLPGVSRTQSRVVFLSFSAPLFARVVEDARSERREVGACIVATETGKHLLEKFRVQGI